jgi:hypothetical protein
MCTTRQFVCTGEACTTSVCFNVVQVLYCYSTHSCNQTKHESVCMQCACLFITVVRQSLSMQLQLSCTATCVRSVPSGIFLQLCWQPLLQCSYQRSRTRINGASFRTTIRRTSPSVPLSGTKQIRYKYWNHNFFLSIWEEYGIGSAT